MDCWLKNFIGWFFCSEKPSGEMLNQQYSINYKYYQVIDLKYLVVILAYQLNNLNPHRCHFLSGRSNYD